MMTMNVLLKILLKRKMKRANFPRLLISDFDGCLTDDSVYVDSSGNEFIRASRKDGQGASRIMRLGIPILILSSETNPVVETRARKMGVDCIQAVVNKEIAIETYAASKQISLKNIWFIGNDINDMSAMSKAGLSLCPMDASPEVLRLADVVLPIKGGDGILNFVGRFLERKSTHQRESV